MLIQKGLKFPSLGGGIAIQAAFDTEGWWITHREASGREARTYLFLGPTIQKYSDGTIVNIHFFWFKLTIAVLKKDQK